MLTHEPEPQTGLRCESVVDLLKRILLGRRATGLQHQYAASAEYTNAREASCFLLVDDSIVLFVGLGIRHRGSPTVYYAQRALQFHRKKELTLDSLAHLLNGDTVNVPAPRRSRGLCRDHINTVNRAGVDTEITTGTFIA